MRKLRTLLVLFSLTSISGLYAAWSQHGTVITTDGTTYTGMIQSRSGQIEWRQDIYEVVDENGEKEMFILEPSMKGRMNLSEVKEIRLLAPNTGPSHYATLADNTKAKLLLKYVIIKKNDSKLYISDFITLNDYALDLLESEGKKQVYITRISRLQFHDQSANSLPMEPGNKGSTPDLKKKAVFVQQKEENSTSMKETESQDAMTNMPEKKTSNISMAFIILSAVFFILFVVILTILLTQMSKNRKYKVVSKKKKQKRH